MSTLDIPNNTGEMIRRYRNEKGWSLRKLARRVGVSHTAVRYWEQGDPMSMEHFLTVVRELDIDWQTVAEVLSRHSEDSGAWLTSPLLVAA